MERAIILHAIVPVRAEAREQAEQTTQLLFGEIVRILQTRERWLHIHNETDGQEGWCDRKMITPLSEDEWQQVRAARKQARVCMPISYAVSRNNGQTIPLSLGTVLYDYADGTFNLLGVPFQIDANTVATSPLPLSESNLQQVCRFLLNVPYLWGGKNGLGMDCSGMVQQVMTLFGIQLPRNASEQAQWGIPIADLQQAQAGDLVFMCHPDQDKVTHVGILLSSATLSAHGPQATLIHCSGRVQIETLTPEGIPTHRLLSIRRMTEQNA